MKIILKYIFQSIMEKKSRLILLLLSIVTSTMLFVVSIGLVEVILNSYTSAYDIVFEEKGISITSRDMKFFEMDDFEKDGLSTYEGEIVSSAVLQHEKDDEEIVYLTLRGKSVEKIKKNYERYELEGELGELKGNQCIISKRISQAFNIKINDEVMMTLNGKDEILKVAAICADYGLFYMDQYNNFSVIVPQEYLADIYMVDNDKYNVVFAKESEKTIMESIKVFDEKNSDTSFVVEALYTDDAISEQYQSFLISMYAMLAIVILTCFVIILGAFSLVIYERLSTIGTFLSTGATKARVKGILLLEGCIYGVVGGVIGDVLSIIVLKIVNDKVSPLAQYGIVEKYHINMKYLVVGLIFAICLAQLSIIIPINKINNMPIKEVILNTFYTPVKIGWRNFILGVGLLLISIVAAISNGEWTTEFAPVFAFTVIIGIILVVTKAVDLLFKLLGEMVKNFSYTLFLALNNLRTSKVLLSNLLLIIVALISSISISAVSDSIVTSLSAAYTDLNYDVSISNIQSKNGGEQDRSTITQELRDMDIVEDESVNPFYDLNGTLEGDAAIKVFGVNPNSYSKYMKYLELDSEKNKHMYKSFSESTENVVIVTDRILRALNKKEGDTVRININQGESKNFTIIGSIDGKMYCTGAFVIVNKDIIANLFGLGEVTDITLTLRNNNEESLIELKKSIIDYGANATTKDEDKVASIRSMSTLCGALAIFSRIVICISVFGILNNMLVGLFQRKKELALLTSVGMDRKRKNLMLFYESLVAFLASAFIIVIYSFLLIELVNKFMIWTGLAIDVTLTASNILFTLGIAFASVLLVTIPVLIKSSKISIMMELRYE